MIIFGCHLQGAMRLEVQPNKHSSGDYFLQQKEIKI